ncbi:hypothetical protein ABPG72_019925, partial [Tetrahymena utriculariae]
SKTSRVKFRIQLTGKNYLRFAKLIAKIGKRKPRYLILNLKDIINYQQKTKKQDKIIKKFKHQSYLLIVFFCAFIFCLKILSDQQLNEYIELKQSDFSKKNIIKDLEQIIKYSQNQFQKQENETKKQDETIKQFKRSNTNLKKQVKSQESTIKDLKEQLQQQLNKNKQFSQIINQQEIYKQENQNLEEKIAKLKQSDFSQKQIINTLEQSIKDSKNQQQKYENENKNLEEKVANQSKSLDYKFSNSSKSFFLSSSI